MSGIHTLKFIILAALMVLTTTCFSQKHGDDDFIFATTELKALEGSFVIEVIGVRAHPSIPVDLADQIIQLKTKPNGGTKYLFPKIRLVVYSDQQINAADFMPPKSAIRYVDQ